MVMSTARVSLLVLFFETLSYGIFLAFYLSTLFILCTKTAIQRRLLIPMATLLFCTATAHITISFIRAFEAFETFTSADIYYTKSASPLNLAQTALYTTQTILADCVTVWRCYVVNSSSLFVAIPGCIALLTNAVIGCYAVWSLSRAATGFAIPITFDSCIITFYALTMVINVTCTGLIAWRIYRVPSVTAYGSRPLLPVFVVIIEAGAVYTLAALTTLGILIAAYGQFIPFNVTTPIVGITFCLVVLQTHFQFGDSYPAKQLSGPRGTTNVSTVLV